LLFYPLVDYQEEQEGELEALKSIYTEDEFTELCNSPWSFVITVKAEFNDLNAQCKIQFDLPDQYPEVLPTISVQSQPNDDVLDVNSIQSFLYTQAEENIGMPMVFALTSAAQDKLQDILDQAHNEVQKVQQEKLEEEKRLEEEKYKGTIVTLETFTEWKKSFLDEKINQKIITECNRLTGKQMFEKDASLALSDVRFLIEDDATLNTDNEVEIDESLFQDLEDLDIDDTTIS
jgi:hypothetical protein